MVIIVAALLSSAAMLLKPMQDRNEAVDQMQSILSAAGFKGVNASNAIEMFNENVTNMVVIDQEGNVVEDYTDDVKENSLAFKIDLKEQLYNKGQGNPFQLPIYIMERDQKKIYIVPLRGAGLWGPVWGNVALKDDFKTVVGVKFGHKSETPGLGAEIETPIFEDQFPGKMIFDDTGKFTSIQVIKSGVASLPADLQRHNVDAISGGTITSNGVGDMLRNVLESYEPYFKKQN